MGFPSAAETYSRLPSFHSPEALTNTDQAETLLCRRLPSLLRKDRARWKGLEIS